MNASEPEADTEYSRGGTPGRGPAGPARGRSEATGPGPPTGSAAARRARRGGPPAAVLGGVLLGAALLVAAEFVPLLRVRTNAYHAGVVATVTAGSHHSYALVPVAALAVVLALVAWRTENRGALAGIVILALAALGIVLAGDLPDVHGSGVILRGGTATLAGASPGPALYLETLGAVVLLLSAGSGLLMARGGRGRSAS